MKISYGIYGRFGNNLFQYLATKLIQHKLSLIGKIYEYSFNTNINQPPLNFLNNAVILTDDNYLYILDNIHIIPHDKNIYLTGYFQFDKHIRENKEYILSILNETNTEKINADYDVSIFAKKIKSYTREFKNDEVVAHIRLDDFLWNKVCMNCSHYCDIINQFPDHIRKIIIIIDKCKEKWELEYLNTVYLCALNKKLFVQIESGDDVFEDFCKLFYSKNLLSSNSSFSYLAGLLGHHTLSWCPNNKNGYPHQKIEIFDENTVSFIATYLPYS